MKKAFILFFGLAALSAIAVQHLSQIAAYLPQNSKEMQEAPAPEPQTLAPALQVMSACAGSYTIPYYNGFESDTLFQTPHCWEDGLVNAIGLFTNSATVIDFNPFQGMQHSELNNANSDTTMLIGPRFSDMPQGQKQLRFMASASDASVSLVVGTLPNQSNYGAFQALDTLYFQNRDQYREYVVEISAARGYNLQDEYLAFLHGNEVTYTNIHIDEVVYDTIPDCARVINPYLSAIGDTSATVDFPDNSGNFKYYWGPAGFLQGTLSIDSASGGAPAVLSPLQANTQYELVIVRDCGSSLSDTSHVLAFTTFCAPFTAPYQNYFDSDSLYQAPQCWVSSISGSGSNRAQVETYNNGSSAFSGKQHLELNSSGNTGASDRTMIVSPAFSDMGAGTHQIRFMASATSGDAALLIGTVSSPQSPQSFVPLDSVFLPSSGFNRDFPTYQEVITEISTANGYNGQHQYIAIQLSKTVGPYTNTFIDNFNYEPVPPCAAPSAGSLGLTAKTSTTATIGWSAGQGLATQLKWGAPGFDPNQSGDSATLSATSYTLANLNTNSSYDIYLRDSCAAGYTYWIGPLSIVTNCSLITAPYSENFDGSSWSVGSGFNNGGDVFDNCWEAVPQTAGQYRWTVGSGPSAGFSTGPNQDVSGSGRYLYSHGSFGFSGDSALVYTPQFDLSALTSPFLEFSYHRFGANMPALKVQIDSSGTWRDVTVVSASPQPGSSAAFQRLGIDISAFPDTTQIRFIMVSNGPNSGDCALDEISIGEAPSCPDPVGLTAQALSDTSATLQWSAVAQAGTYHLWVGPAGFYQGSGTTAGQRHLVSNNSFTLDTLAPDSAYEFLVRAICSPGDSSAWIGPEGFTTPCSAFMAPYSNGFEMASPGLVPDCFTALLPGPGDILTDNAFAATGSWSLKIDNDYFPSDIIAVSPMFSDMTAGDKLLRFAARVQTFAPEELIVGTMSNPGDVSSFKALDTLVISTSFTTYSVPLTANNGYNLSDEYFALKHGNINSFEALFVDDLWYDFLPICPQPDSLQITNSSAGSATVQWTGNAAQYQVEYGLKGFTPGTGSQMNVSGTQATVNLQAGNVANQIFVRAICGPGDTSFRAGPLEIATPPVACDDFEAYNSGAFAGQSTFFESLSLYNVTEISTAQAQSGSQSLHVFQTSFDPSDIGAPIGTLDTGVHKVSMAIYVPVNSSGIIQFFKDYQSYDVAFEVNMSSGIATLQKFNSLGPPTVFGSFNYTGGNWFTLDQYIDFNNDSAYTHINGQSTGVGWQYSQGGIFPPPQLDGVSFLALTNFPNGDDYYIDDFCVTAVSRTSCTAPSMAQTGYSDCDSLSINLTGAADTVMFEYGPQGFTPGSGQWAQSTDSVIGLNSLIAQRHYDFYFSNVCGNGDTSIALGPVTFATDSVPLPLASFAVSAKDTNGQRVVSVDASSSVDGDSLYWDFGNGTTGRGDSSQVAYALNGSYTIRLVVQNACGSDTAHQVINVNIGLEASEAVRDLSLYPNPAERLLHIEIPVTQQGPLELEIVNTTGQIMRQFQTNEARQILEIDISDLPAAVYMLRLSGEAGLSTGSFIKQ